MKLLGKNNDLWKNNKITKAGYSVMAISSIIGFICFLAGKEALKTRNKKRKK